MKEEKRHHVTLTKFCFILIHPITSMLISFKLEEIYNLTNLCTALKTTVRHQQNTSINKKFIE